MKYINTRKGLSTDIAIQFLTLSVPETKIAEFANSVDLDEASHLGLHCFSSSL